MRIALISKTFKDGGKKRHTVQVVIFYRNAPKPQGHTSLRTWRYTLKDEGLRHLCCPPCVIDSGGAPRTTCHADWGPLSALKKR